MPLIPASRMTFSASTPDAHVACNLMRTSRVGAADGGLTAAQTVVILALRIYKLLLSPLFAGSCRFLPTCSDYAREAVLEHGVVRGTWLAARRLSRCHPWGSSGLDPVPGRAPLA